MVKLIYIGLGGISRYGVCSETTANVLRFVLGIPDETLSITFKILFKLIFTMIILYRKPETVWDISCHVLISVQENCYSSSINLFILFRINKTMLLKRKTVTQKKAFQ